MIELKHVSKEFAARGVRVLALDTIDLAVAREEFVALVGPSGCGKSTVLNLVSGLLRPTHGEVWYEGNTGHRRHYLAEHMVAFASDSETLYPGDVLGTGTVGLSCSMDSGRWVQVGQTISFEVEGIGTLSHQVVAGDNVMTVTDQPLPVPISAVKRDAADGRSLAGATYDLVRRDPGGGLTPVGSATSSPSDRDIHVASTAVRSEVASASVTGASSAPREPAVSNAR